jgi:hypothetical protein
MNIQDEALSVEPKSRWRRAGIVGVKAIHSVIFLANSAAILHVFYAGVRGRRSVWTAPAVMLAFIESGVFLANRERCPLTGAVEALGAEHGRVSDIFLPRWLADHIPQLFTPPLVIGVLALVYKDWRQCRPSRSRVNRHSDHET